MVRPEKDIEFTVFYEGQEYAIKTYPNEYRNLMMLIYDRIYTEDFGDCLGMGKCGTCLVEITGNRDELTSYKRNEETTITKAGLESGNVRLSCQLMIDHHFHGVRINVI